MPPRSWVNSAAHDRVVQVLVQERETAGLTQRDLAGRLGKDASTIARIETGQRNVSILEFVAITRALGAEPLEVLARVIAQLPADWLS